jgi:two-component system sensor histidine kinase RegB
MQYPSPSAISDNRNLKRLYTLRSFMIAGYLLVFLSLRFLLDIQLPTLPLLSIISLLCAVNLWTWQQVRNAGPVPDREFFYQLCVDVAAIGGLLYFTGGATNPFAWLFLIPLMIAATVLSARATWIIAGLSIACYSLLMRYHVPLGAATHMQHDDSFSQHVFGMWFGFVMSAGLIAWFVVGMANTLRERDQALAKAREQALRDEKLVALGTLATGTAHELGTPLATMAVVIRELERSESTDSSQRKLAILDDQIGRCKRALSALAVSAGEARAESGSLVNAGHFIEDIIDNWKQQRNDAMIDVSLDDSARQATLIGEQTLIQALVNLLNNAADASPQSLFLEAGCDHNNLYVDVLDRGPGIHSQIDGTFDRPTTSQKEFGMGLGLFLAHATIQRLSGDIELSARSGGGTRTHIRIPLTTR